MRELEADLGIPKATVSEILMQDLGVKRCTKIPPAVSAPEQKEHHATVANYLIQIATNGPDLASYYFWLFPKLK